MPCDQVRITQIDMSKASATTIKRAGELLGYKVTNEHGVVRMLDKHGYCVATWRQGGDVTVYDDAFTEKEFQGTYAQAAVEQVAKKHAAWAVKKVSTNKFVVRRSY